MKGNLHKKMTYESKFTRHFACWVKNNRKKWHWYKTHNRKRFRRLMKGDVDSAAD